MCCFLLGIAEALLTCGMVAPPSIDALPAAGFRDLKGFLMAKWDVMASAGEAGAAADRLTTGDKGESGKEGVEPMAAFSCMAAAGFGTKWEECGEL